MKSTGLRSLLHCRLQLAWLGVAIALALGLLPIGRWGSTLFPRAGLWGPEAAHWIVVAIILGYVVLIERRPLSSVGFRRPKPLDLLLAVLIGILMVVGIVLIYSVVLPILHLRVNAAEISKLRATPFVFRLMLVTRAAVSEELLYRGYLLERFRELTGGWWIGAVVSWLAFTYAHLSGWGAPQLIVAGYGGLLLTALYVWRRELWANVLGHWVADGAGFLLPG